LDRTSELTETYSGDASSASARAFVEGLARGGSEVPGVYEPLAYSDLKAERGAGEAAAVAIC
jgi:hypothetical protein